MNKTEIKGVKELKRGIPQDYKGIPLREWIATDMKKGVGNPRWIKIIIYTTKKNFALKIMSGYGDIGALKMPKAWTNGTIDYRKKLESIFKVLENKLDYYGVEYE